MQKIICFLLACFSTLFVHLPVSRALLCGPNHICTCSELPKHPRVFGINCRRTGVDLRGVCKYILDSNITKQIQLDVSKNNITTINKIDLQWCKNVTTLNLSENNISHIEKDVFSYIKTLTELDLSYNNLFPIYHASTELFISNLPQLQKLHLNGNFKSTTNASFDYPNLSSLASLNSLTIDGLSDTKFSESYRALTKLETLNMNGSVGICYLGKLKVDTFMNIRSVKVLDLSACNITSIDAETFAPLGRLRWLDLSLNRQLGFTFLRNVSYGLQFTEIDFLDYSRTQKTFGLGTQLLKRDLCYLHNTSLREISMNGNRIERFETNLFILLPPTLQKVHVEENTFTFGPYLMQMGCLHNLTHVFANLQNKMHNPTKIYNKESFNVSDAMVPIQEDCPYMDEGYLKNLSHFISNCNFIEGPILNFNSYSAPPNLETCSFANSNLKSEVGKLFILPTINRMKHIDFSENVMYSLVGPVGPLPSVNSVNLSMNYCSHIGTKFFSLAPLLETLDLSKNYVGIPLTHDTNGEIFKSLKKLKHLFLPTNQIKTLHERTFQHLVNLELLDLSFNTIGDFTPSVSSLRNLTLLRLENNAIQSLPESVINHFDYMKETRHLNFSINLYENPIRCSCKNKRFLQWMLKHRANFEFFENYTFLNDEGQHLKLNEFLSLVNNFDKTCRSYTVLIIVTTLFISVFISVVLGGFVYKNRWKLRYFLYRKRRRFYGYFRLPNEDTIENYRYDAFISYTNNDIRFVRDKLIPILEGDSLRLCIHERDFLAGNHVGDNIIDAIETSRKTVVLLSNAFLKSKWCHYEFQMARMESIYSRDYGGCLIVVMLEPVPVGEMPLEMVRWIRYESYLEYTSDELGYELFWTKLREAINKTSTDLD